MEPSNGGGQSAQPRPGTIEIDSDHGRFRDSYLFVARDADGNVVLRSPMYDQPFIRLGGSGPEREHLQRFLTELAVIGWQAVHTGPRWSDYRIYQVGSDNVAVPQAQAQRQGLSPGAMWGWSVVVVLVLFALCVVLVLSVELRVSPA